MRVKTWLALAVCTFTGLVISGCGTATGPAVQKNMDGSLTTSVAADPQRATQAARQAAHELSLLNVASGSSQLDGWVEAETAQGQDVDIDVSRWSDDTSRVNVRVGGFMADRAAANSIIARMKSILGDQGTALGRFERGYQYQSQPMFNVQPQQPLNQSPQYRTQPMYQHNPQFQNQSY